MEYACTVWDPSLSKDNEFRGGLLDHEEVDHTSSAVFFSSAVLILVSVLV